ncbi:hypothetical protein BDA99DRAFT_558725 [Phascolomyces articulosus]|uniref:F-box domain-containing protein n=1 Tax=Phascolomyces articulosus TaxID=60185 RepID=A0AAD5K2V1_9FUNG|nr:hypothetical protein BDA99DRAFT_558725 [Phascolomyces articulosus]
MELQTQHDNRLSLLPQHIQDDIFSFLSTQELWKCCSVCSSWRSSILHWSDMWRYLSTHDNQKIVPALLPYRSYIKGPFVKAIAYGGDNDDEHFDAVTDFLVELNCDALVQVAIISDYVVESNIVRLLDMSSNTLTRIFVMFNDDDEANIMPDVILRHCPHLRHLYFVGSSYDEESWDPQRQLLDFQHQRLVDLEIEFYSIEGNFDIRPFLQATPKLKHLGLNINNIEHTWRTLPSLIHAHCPRLLSLFIVSNDDGGVVGMGDQEQEPFWRENTRKTDYKELLLATTSKDEPPASLQRLMVHNTFNDCEGGNELIPVLCEAFQNSLKHFDIKGRILFSESEALTRFSRLHAVPNLTNITIYDLSGDVDDTLLESICTGSRYLEKLILEGCSNMTEAGLMDFLTNIAKQQQHSDAPTLRSIEFKGISAITSRVLDTIALEYHHMGELIF